MADKPLDFSVSNIPEQIQSNLVAYMRLFADLPGIVTKDDDVFWIVSNKPAPGNIILRTNWTDENNHQKDTLFREIGQHTDHIDWMVFPNDKPTDLSHQLEIRGIPAGKGGNWLWADLTEQPIIHILPKNFRIERVRDDRMMAEWIKISKLGFESELPYFYDAYTRHGYEASAFSLHYIGYLRKTPVISGTVLDSGGCASIYDVSTHPKFRGQGFGGAIMNSMMQEIRSRGYKDTWIWSSEMAKKVYRTLGYVDADFGIREHNWHK